MGDASERRAGTDDGRPARPTAAATPPDDGWRPRLVGLGILVALEVPLILLLASANGLSAGQAVLTVLVISGGTALATAAAFLLRREEEQVERLARAAALRERAEGPR
ncbi:MAG TPA: hypothetical protein VIL36_23965 [Acidimicrobiales bacterium]